MRSWMGLLAFVPLLSAAETAYVTDTLQLGLPVYDALYARCRVQKRLWR